MAVSDSFSTFVLEQLDGVPNITSGRMFGCVGLYSGERFFGLIDDDRLYFKVDARNVGDYTRAGMGAFRPDPKRPTTMSYCEVPVSVLEDRDELAKWARRSVEVAASSGVRRERKGRASRRARTSRRRRT